MQGENINVFPSNSSVAIKISKNCNRTQIIRSDSFQRRNIFKELIFHHLPAPVKYLRRTSHLIILFGESVFILPQNFLGILEEWLLGT